MKKIVALLLVFVFVFAIAACGDKADTTTTTAADDAATTLADVIAGATTVAGETTAAGETTSAAATTLAAADLKLPQTKEEILAAYTAVMNQAKLDKPSFNKVEFQALPDDAASRQIREGKGLVSTLLKVAGNFMTTEEKASKDPEFREKGGDMRWFPVYKVATGCFLTDANFIKSASAKQLPDGNYQLTIVLNSEKNPEPCPDGAKAPLSKVGSMFNPLSRKDIDDTLNNNSIVNTVVKDIDYSLVYHDCKAVLTYDPQTNHVVGLEHYMYVTITGSGRVILAGAFDLTQELVNTMKIYNIKY